MGFNEQVNVRSYGLAGQRRTVSTACSSAWREIWVRQDREQVELEGGKTARHDLLAFTRMRRGFGTVVPAIVIRRGFYRDRDRQV